YAERTLDERHREACQQRRVWVVDREDGMSDLTAHLPSVEAHAIFDRLTRASRVLANVEQREQRARREQHEVDEPQSASLNVDEGAAVDPLESPQAPTAPVFVCRSRDELRTDLFSELLRTGLNDALNLV